MVIFHSYVKLPEGNHTAEIPLKIHFPAEAPEKNIMCSAETSKKHHVSCLNSH